MRCSPVAAIAFWVDGSLRGSAALRAAPLLAISATTNRAATAIAPRSIPHPSLMVVTLRHSGRTRSTCRGPRGRIGIGREAQKRLLEARAPGAELVHLDVCSPGGVPDGFQRGSDDGNRTVRTRRDLDIEWRERRPELIRGRRPRTTPALAPSRSASFPSWMRRPRAMITTRSRSARPRKRAWLETGSSDPRRRQSAARGFGARRCLRGRGPIAGSSRSRTSGRRGAPSPGRGAGAFRVRSRAPGTSLPGSVRRRRAPRRHAGPGVPRPRRRRAGDCEPSVPG